MKKISLAMIAALAASAASAITGTVRTETDSTTGDIRWNSPKKQYDVTVSKNGAKLNRVFTPAMVVELKIDKPKNYDKLMELVAGKQGAQAVKGLEEIVKAYKMLVWDKPAGRALVTAYLDMGQAQKAYDSARAIIADDPSAAIKGDLAPAYWQSLYKLNKTTQLENCLREAASCGDRATSAEALMMRGDITMAEGGDSPEAVRKALTDGYLRVALMYSDCKNQQRDAMLRCAEAFGKLGQDARATSFKQRAGQL